MLSFFDKSFDQQVKIAIDIGDSKLLQVLLGPKYLQLWQYWMVHSTLSYNTLAIIKVIEYQLPIDVINSYRSILEGKFPYVNVDLGYNLDATVPKEKIEEINNALKDSQNKILARYNKRHLNSIGGPEGQMVSIPFFYDAVREIDYAMYSNFDEYSERETDIKGFIDKFSGDPAFTTVLALDFTTQCQDMIGEVQKQVQLQVVETEYISDFIYELMECYKVIQPYDEKLEEILDQIRKNILNKIKDGKFVDEMYEKLLDNVLNTAKEKHSHPLYQDRLVENKDANIKNIIRKNNSGYDINMLNNFLEYAAKKSNPNLNIVSILLINGASLLAAQVYNIKEQVSQSVSQYFLRSQSPDLELFSSRSIYTIMRDAHNILFDFPIIEGEIDLSKVLSVIPSRLAEFKNDAKEKAIFTKIGEKGERELMGLLSRYQELVEDKDKEHDKDKRNAVVDLWSSFCKKFAGVKINDKVDKNYALIHSKLNECINIGYLAIATGDDKVIIDHALKIKEEQKCEKDRDVRKLYDIFLTILYENKDLVKLPWWEWKSISYKTKRLIQCKPAWDKILTIPELNKNKKYDTRVSEWSHENFSSIQSKSAQENLAKSKELEQRNQVIQQQSEVLQQRDQIIQKQNLEKHIMRALLKKTSKLSKGLQEIINESDNEIVEKVLQSIQEHDSSPEQVIDVIIEEIKLHRIQVMINGRIDTDIIVSGIKRLFSQERSSTLDNISVSQAGVSSSVNIS